MGSMRDWRNFLNRSVFTLVLAAALAVGGTVKAQYSTGDYGSWVTGAWNTAGTWRVYNGVSWLSSPVAATPPNAGNNVFILPGTTVTATFGTVYHCLNLTVEAGGKIYNNDTGPTNLSYITIYGTTLRCDGTIGNSPTLDGISFNIEGTNVLLSGTGQFEAARIRKNFNSNPVTAAALTNTSLTIDMDILLRFSGGTNTMIYNNYDGTTIFNVTINAGRTVTLSGLVGFGNVAIDGVDGASTHSRGGHFTVNGTLIVPGVLYLTTNNTNLAQQCRFTINNGGYVRCNQLNAGASGTAGHVLTVAAGGTLEIIGSPVAWTLYSTTNNTYALNAASQVIYSASGGQDVRNITGGYGHLRLTGSGVKALSGAVLVKGDLQIQGTAQFDATASNFQVSVQGNWSSYGPTGFIERTALVQFNGTAGSQSINTVGGEQFHNWRVAKSAAQPLVPMLSPVQVANNLELNTAAILDLNGNQLTLLNPLSTAIATNSTFGTLRHIRSERTDNTSRVRWDIGTDAGPHLVPFGTTTAYTPFTFNLVSGDAGSVTMATYGTGADNLPWPTTPTLVTNLQSGIGLMPDNRDATVDRFWQVDVTGSPLAHLTFTYAASELPATPWDDAFSMRAQRWNAGVPKWEDQLESGGALPYLAVANNVDAFGPFTLTPVLSPLPVELLSFTAKPVGKVVELEWLTASERNNEYFTVLRSADGFRFEEVLRVPGMGNSAQVLRYTGVDDQPLNGVSYYRLRQTDTNGSEALSEVVAVRRDAGSDEVMLFPNPATESVRIFFTGTAEGVVLIDLFDGTGRLLMQRTVQAGGDLLDVSALPRGAYIVRSTDARFAPQRLILR